MKVLVAASGVILDTTSGGICTSKTIRLMSRAGHEVVCLTSDPGCGDRSGWFTLPWLGDVPVKHVSTYLGHRTWARLHSCVKAISASGRAGAYAARKMDAAFAYATGFKSATWSEVECWFTAIRHAVKMEKPDLLFACGAGGNFRPHLAMLRWRPAVPWIANYHDPFPLSLYPEPYRVRVPLVSWWQEAVHRRIVERADALTFPSQRLLEWVLSGKLAAQRQKAYVISHLAMDLPNDGVPVETNTPHLDPHCFNIVHTGTLLGPRVPWALLDGFRDFLDQDAEKRRLARLTLVGAVNRKHVADERWQQITRGGSVVSVNQRIPYHQALELTRSATATVVLEANSPESPFLPAKVADYLWLRKPILALSPRQSAVADILGPDYPLLVAPDDAKGVTSALNTIWDHWKAGDLEKLSPSQNTVASISEGVVQEVISELLSKVASNCQSTRGR